MEKSEILQYDGQMFDLDGTLTDSINAYKNPLLLPNYLRLKKGTLTLKQGAPELLHCLKDHGKSLALITHMNYDLLQQYLNCGGINKDAPIRETFDPMLITGMGGGNRPYTTKTDLMLSTLDVWKMKNDRAIYYGDTLNDAIASHDAKIKFCLVGNADSKKDLKEIQKISPLQIKNFTDLSL